MCQILKYIFVFFIFFSCSSSAQKFRYKDIPDNYLKKISVTEIERVSICNGLIKPIYIEKELPKHYVKDGSVDYTTIIQTVLDKNNTIVFPNFPLLINEKGLTVKSNSNIYFPEKAKIILKANKLGQYEILRIHDVENVKVYFPNIQGDRYVHTAKDGEWGMGISIRGTNNVLIYGGKVEKCWGDGIYLGISPITNNVINNNIKIQKSLVDDNRRNGISIISAQNSVFEDLITSNTFGTAPNAGIDIEPNANSDIIKNLTFNNVVAYNNDVHGFLFVFSNLYGKKQNIGVINIANFTSNYSQYGVSLKIGTDKEKHIGVPYGKIIIDNPTLVNTSRQSLLSYKENDKNNFSVRVKSIQESNRNEYFKFIKSSKNIIISK